MFEGFWDNVFRYPRYMITIIFGIFYSIFLWLKPLLERPVTAIALVLMIVAGFCFITLTLRAMLGLSSV
ncbi:MAG: DUF751 family protein [Symploca sp. SIO2E6]|nr:DUF751 family protein [Symploca sp. SIO2E6]